MSMPSTLATFFVSRWRGRVPLPVLFWRDMLLVGTAVNLTTGLVALGLLSADAPLGVVLAVHFATQPYNVFLFLAVWRTSALAGGWIAQAAPLGAAGWLMLAAVV